MIVYRVITGIESVQDMFRENGMDASRFFVPARSISRVEQDNATSAVAKATKLHADCKRGYGKSMWLFFTGFQQFLQFAKACLDALF